MTSPLVSVIMNCFNGEQYLRKAIDSVIAQTYQNWELIFYDNQSIDNSAEIFKKYKLDDIKQAHIDIESRKIIGPAVIIP